MSLDLSRSNVPTAPRNRTQHLGLKINCQTKPLQLIRERDKAYYFGAEGKMVIKTFITMSRGNSNKLFMDKPRMRLAPLVTAGASILLK